LQQRSSITPHNANTNQHQNSHQNQHTNQDTRTEANAVPMAVNDGVASSHR
jgi:hypothetical protein